MKNRGHPAEHAECCEHGRWLEALWNPHTKVECNLAGHSALSSDWRIGPRSMDLQFIFYVEKGEATGHIQGKRTRLRPGTLLWTDLGTLHHFHPVEDQPAPTCFHIRFRILDGNTSMGFGGGHLIRHDAFRFQWLIEEVHRNMNHPHELQDMRLKSLYFYLYSELTTTKNDTAGQGTLSTKLCSRIISFVQSHRHVQVTPSQLAKTAELSPDYFTRVFRRTFDMPPRQWLLRERLKHAAFELTNSPQLTVTEIADRFGYCDVFLFSRQFKKAMGHSPSIYRQIYG